MTTINRIIYLDFDGVLHPTSPVIDGLFSRAHLLEDLFTNIQSEVFIVVSSSWRFTHSLAALQAKLPTTLAQRVINTTGTPIIGKFARYQEILAHASKLDPGTQWRALDDSYWEFPANCSELIRCNPNTGIGPKEITKLATWLSNASASI
jgi:HAD domain in Swiss Army Knife RNA repair proteins